MKLAGQTAIVTGGASGLGAATARALAAAGAKVGVIDLDRAGGEKVAAEIGGAFAAADVADAVGAESAIRALQQKQGTARVLANCAGIANAGRIVGREGPMPLEAFEKVIRVNLIGTFNMMRLVASEMYKLVPLEGGERGVIVSTASVAAFDGQLGQAAYAASKGGIHSMTLPAAREFAKFGIRVMTIAPGLFETPLMGTLTDEARAGLSESVQFPARLGRPEEFAALVLSVIENPYLNGETIRLDGAVRLPPR